MERSRQKEKKLAQKLISKGETSVSPSNGVVVVTNGYKVMLAKSHDLASLHSAVTYSRYELRERAILIISPARHNYVAALTPCCSFISRAFEVNCEKLGSSMNTSGPYVLSN